LALVGDPDLIFLDEPTTGFDPAARRQAWSTIRSLCELGDIPEVPAQSRTLEADRVLILTTEPVPGRPGDHDLGDRAGR